jgi:hypothetical protein
MRKRNAKCEGVEIKGDARPSKADITLAPGEDGVFAFDGFEALNDHLALIAFHAFSNCVAKVSFQVIAAKCVDVGNAVGQGPALLSVLVRRTRRK